MRIRERGRVVHVSRKAQNRIEAFEETAKAGDVSLRSRQHDHSRRLKVSGPGTRVGDGGVYGGEPIRDDSTQLLEQFRYAPALARLQTSPFFARSGKG